MKCMTRAALTTLALGVATASLPSPVAAHCDSMDGPVVKAAQRALASGEVAEVLGWVRSEDEAEIRQAFVRTMGVRELGADARDLADRWFFETLVRVHRAGEGAPYTGLKPAGYEPPEGIAAADRALADGTIDGLVSGVTEQVGRTLRERFEAVRALQDRPPHDIEAGRRYVHAYVQFIHFVESLHEILHAEGTLHGA